MVKQVKIFILLLSLYITILAEHEALAAAPQIAPNTDNYIQLNKDAFNNLKNYGDVGNVLYEVFTNENALGKYFARIFKEINTKYQVSLNDYQTSLDKIFYEFSQPEVSEPINSLFDKIADVGDPDSNMTFGRAREILMNIASNSDKLNEIKRRITAPVENVEITNAPAPVPI